MKEGIDVIDDVGMARRTHDKDFIDDEVLFGLFLEIHLLDSNGEIGADLVGGIDATRSTDNRSDEARGRRAKRLTPDRS